MAQKRPLTIEEFDLLKVKYNSKTGVEIDYFEKSDRKDEINVKSDTPPHPDLLEALKKLCPHVAHVLGLQRGWDYSRENLRHDEGLLKGAVTGAKDADNAVTVSGIRMAGKGKNRSVKITGSLKCLTGAIGFASPLIVFQNNSLAIEKTVEAICEDIKNEVYSYLFSNKVASKQEEIEFDGQEKGAKKKKGRKPLKQTDIEEQANEGDLN